MATPITDGMPEQSPKVVAHPGHTFTDPEGNKVTIGSFHYFILNEPTVFGERQSIVPFWERVRIAFWFYVAPIAFVFKGRCEVPRGGVRFKQTNGKRS